MGHIRIIPSKSINSRALAWESEAEPVEKESAVVEKVDVRLCHPPFSRILRLGPFVSAGNKLRCRRSAGRLRMFDHAIHGVD